MANFKITEDGFLLESSKAFIPSESINIFPCARRGQISTDSLQQYDPEARLNTERTNRIHIAVNGFKDSFIATENFTIGDTLVFVLAGYRVEVKNFDPAVIAGVLGTDIKNLYAYLRLQTEVPLDTTGYYTEILYRQSSLGNDKNYLDVSYPVSTTIQKDFFTGVSFVKEPLADKDENDCYLHLFSYGTNWELVQTSLLPKIEHGETEDSIKLSAKLSAGATDVDSLIVDGTTYLKSTAQIDGETTLYNKLLVKSGNITRAEIDSAKVSFNLPVTVNDTLLVKRTTGTGPAARVEGSLEVHEGISTETINANTIQSVETLKTDSAKGLVVTSTAVSPERTLKIDGKTDISGDADIEGRLTVSSNIDTNTLKATTNIVTPLITSENAGTEIVVDRVLKVDTINSDSANGLTVNRKLTANRGVEVLTGYEVKTPTLRVDRITSSNTDNIITIDNKKLVVNRSLEMRAPAPTEEKPNPDPAKATIEQAVIGELTVKVDSGLKNSTGKITTLNLQATNNATIYDLDVGTNIDTGTLKATSEVATPTLKTNTITSDAAEIVIDKQLKVEDNINVGTPTTPATVENGGYIVAKKDITAEQDLIAKRDISASEKATVKSLVVGTRVDADSKTSGVITAKALVRTPSMEVNTITSPNSNIVVSKTLQLDNGLAVKETSTLATTTATKITANELWLEDTNKTSMGQVPAVELAYLTATDTYQVRLKFGAPITIIEE